MVTQIHEKKWKAENGKYVGKYKTPQMHIFSHFFP